MIYNTFYVIFFLCVLSAPLSAQQWLWSNQLRSNGDVFPSQNVAIDIATDNSNNVYFCGHYDSNPLTIGNITIPNAGNWDGFVCKFNSTGKVLWVNQLGGSGRDEAAAMAVVGNYLFVVGSYKSNPMIIGSASLSNTDNNYEIYLAKYDLNGNFIKATRIFWGAYADRAKDMIYDSELKKLVITGQFNHNSLPYTMSYYNGTSTTTVNAKSSKDMFVAQMDTSGAVSTFKDFWTTNNGTVLKDINLIPTQGYYLSGDLTGTLYFSSTDSISGDAVNTDALVVRVDKSLNLSWARRGGGIGFDHANSAISDQYGSLYLTGKIEGTVQFDSTATQLSSPKTGFGMGDIFLAKYNKQGNLLWFKRKGGPGDDDGYGIEQRENLVQFCGNYSDTVIFNQDTLKSKSINDYNTSFAVFDLDGNEIGAQGIQGDSTDAGRAINFDNNGNTIIAGYSYSNPLIIGDSSFTNTSLTRNGFIAEFNYPMLVSFSSHKSVTCAGGNDGQLIITPYFGVGPYTYTWSGNVTSSIDSFAYHLPAGNYSVTVTDSRTVSASNNYTITEPVPINISALVTNVSCNTLDGAGNDGAINLTVGGGTVANGNTYTYSWTALSGSGANVSSQNQTSLTAGKYKVIVQDDNLCSATDTFIVSQPDSFSFAGSIVTDASGGGNNGAINLTVSGENTGSPYTYAWSNAAITQDLVNIPGASYTVTVTDSKSCKQDTTFVVNDLSLLIAYISKKTDVDCFGASTGSATVRISGGTGPYAYHWENKYGTSISIDSTISNIPSGTYYVTVTDNFDARTAQTSVQITEPSQTLTASIAGKNPSCYGQSTGVADLTASGGSLPYSFSWSNGATTEDLNNIQANTYTVTVTDVNGCKASDQVTLTDPSAMDLVITVDQPVLCHGDVTGTLSALASGGQGTKSYIWDDPGSQTSRTATGLAAGTYTVTATDIANCSISQSIQLSEPSILTVNETHLDASCYGNKDGSIILSVSGGTPSYNYGWSNGQASQNLSSIGAGTYNVTVTDKNNCQQTMAVDIAQPQKVTLNQVSVTNASCNGSSDGQLQVNAAGGTGSYSYSIDGGTNYSTSAQFNNLAAQNYTLRAKDSNNCESNDTIVTLHQPVGTTITSQKSTNVTCNGNADGTISIQATNPVGGLTFSIDGGQTFGSDSVFTNVSPGTYQIVLKDADNCTTQGNDLTVTQPLPLTVDTTITNALGDVNGAITVSASGGTAPYRYVLTIPTTDSNAVTTNGQFSDLPPGTYKITLADSNSCTSDTINCTVLQASKAITIYNAFSPNGDGMNDKWHIGNISLYPNCTVTIFNTWGNKVFVSKGYNVPWDGKYNGKDLPAATYYYVIDLGNGTKPYTGSVTIVR